MRNKLLSLLTKEQLINELENLGSSSKIAQKYGINLATVYSAFKLLDLNGRVKADAKNIITKELLQKEYAELQSFSKVAEKLGVSKETIRFYIRKFALDYNKLVLYDVDHNFFQQETEQSFYLAGFIAADGCVKERSGASRVLSIGLAMRDKEFLQQIKKTLKAENPITDRIVKNSNDNPNYNDTWSSSITITSKQIFDDLAKFNIVPRKSLIYTFPEWVINHPLVHHFMRGYFDGDGSFYIPKLVNYDGCNRTVMQVFFALRGTPKFLTVYRSILEENDLVKKRNTDIRMSSGQGILGYGGNGVLTKICKFLYKDATLFLPRKRDIVQHLL
jgi:hypothetical protein